MPDSYTTFNIFVNISNPSKVMQSIDKLIQWINDMYLYGL